MKLGSSLWYLALTAGIAVFALVGPRVDVDATNDVAIDGDAWFV